MTKSEAVRWAGSGSELARRCGVTRQAVWVWRDHLPLARQQQIEALSGGKLLADTWEQHIARRAR